MNVWKSFLGLFRFSGWNCFKNYENVEKGECQDSDNPPITDDCQQHETHLVEGYQLLHSLFNTNYKS